MSEEERSQQSSQPQNPPVPQPPLSQRFSQQSPPQQEESVPAPVQPPKPLITPPQPSVPPPQLRPPQEQPVPPVAVPKAPAPTVPSRVAPQEHYLKREDVRTMEKDIASLRHQETKKERERITEIQQSAAKQPLDEQAAIERIRREAEAARAPREAIAATNTAPVPTVELSRELPHTPSHFQKVFIRVVIGVFVVGIIINIGIVGYWYFFKRDGGGGLFPAFFTRKSPAPTPVATATPLASPTAVPTITATPRPSSSLAPTPQQTSLLLPLARTAVIILSQGENFILPLQRVFEQNNPEGFTKIEFKKEGQSQPVQLGEFFVGLNITVPQEVQGQLQNPLLLFLFNGDRERIGFVTKLKDETAAKTAMKNWESTLEQNTAVFTGLMGGKDSGYNPRFRSYTYNEVAVRFKTLSRNDIGICYAIYKNQLIFTTSLEAMEKVIDTLK